MADTDKPARECKTIPDFTATGRVPTHLLTKNPGLFRTPIEKFSRTFSEPATASV